MHSLVQHHGKFGEDVSRFQGVIQTNVPVCTSKFHVQNVVDAQLFMENLVVPVGAHRCGKNGLVTLHLIDHTHGQLHVL